MGNRLETRPIEARHLFRSAVCLLLLLFAITGIAHAADKPQTIVVLISGAIFDDILPNGRLPAVRELAARGAISLLHNHVWGDFNTNAALLSVGASERMAAPASGPLDLETLRRFQPPVANRSDKAGSFGDAMARAGIGVRASGSPLGEKLVTVSSMPSPPGQSSVNVIACADCAQAEEVVQTFLSGAEPSPTTMIVAAPDTPVIEGGSPYRHLGFVVEVAPEIAPDTVLTSPTTRTPGLIANVDLLPTVAARYDVTIPDAAGRLATVVTTRSERWGDLQRIDAQTDAAARATIPVLLGYGIWAGIALLFSIAALTFNRPPILRAARFGLLLAAAPLVALLPVGIVAPQTPLLYGGAVAGVSIVLAVAAYASARPLRFEPLRAIYLLLTTVVGIDALFGSPVVGRSLFAGNFLSGIRFYGVGNEYSGLAVGAAVAGLAPWWLCIFLVGAIGLPYFGAKAGGTIGSCVAFVIQFLALKQRRFRFWQVAAAFGVAALVMLLFACLDRLQPAGARSHIGTAVATGQAHGAAALAEIAARKLAMNFRLASSGWTILAVAALVPIWLLLSRGAIGKRLTATLEKRPQLRTAVVPAAIWGAIATGIFNDSGSVAFLLFLLPLTVALLDALLTDAIEQTGKPIG